MAKLNLFNRALPSPFASDEAIAAPRILKQQLKGHVWGMVFGGVEKRRAILDEHYFGPRIDEARGLYPITEMIAEIDGVYCERFAPAEGIPTHNQDRILINLHGGGFAMGARTEGRLESIPVASTAKMQVISIDYRQGPEHRFPAASEDVATVYRHLLKSYQPQNIGIFGTSAGGILTAQSIAWFLDQGLPLPGAAGIFCAGAGLPGKGDSMAISRKYGVGAGTGIKFAYMQGADFSSPLAAPLKHPSVMAQFPPTLLITSSRDFCFTDAIVTHRALIRENVETDLHVFEGVGHYFYGNTGLPEARDAFKTTANFFSRHLRS